MCRFERHLKIGFTGFCIFAFEFHAIAAPSPELAADQQKGSGELCVFPDKSMGSLYQLKHGKRLPLFAASGTCRLPQKSRLGLRVSLSSKSQISKLAALPAGLLYELDASKADLEPEDLEAIAGCKSLASLMLKQNHGLGRDLAPVFAMSNLSSLNLAEMGLKSRDLTGVARLAGLRRLNLDGNKQLDDACMTEIARLKNLDWLFLSRTQVTGKGINLLKERQGFKCVSFASLYTGDALAPFLRQNKKLEYLDLSSSSCSKKDLAEILLKESELKTLYLSSNNAVDDSFLSSLSCLKKLLKLNLASTNISSKGICNLRALAELEYLNLSSCAVDYNAAGCLGGIASLKVLILNNSSLTDAGLKALAAVKGLRELELSDNKLSDSGCQMLSKLTQLNSLDLSSCSVGDNALVAISKLQNLSSLQLASTKVSDKGLLLLSRMKSLRFLDLRNTAVTTAQARAFKKANQNCKILHDFN